MKTLFELEQSRPPYESAKVMAVNLPVMNLWKTPEQVRISNRDVKERVSALPGVEHVHLASSTPWRDEQGLGIGLAFAAQGATRTNGQERLPRQVPFDLAGMFFETFGVPLIQGRDFNDGDKEGSERVVIISQSLAQMLYPGQDAVNRHLGGTDGVIKFIGISGRAAEDCGGCAGLRR